VLADPRHPYTQALLSVVPSPVPRTGGDRRTILDPEGLFQVGGGHGAACWKVGG
jgi:ABC-type dipeptide/oligopeptide/nickel transport system ATPase component